MLNKIKTSMRIYHDGINAEIESNIEVCMLDLQRVGVPKTVATKDSEDGLIYKAAELYCKWQYDFCGKGEQFMKAYEKLRDAISLCGSYTESEEIANV